MNYGNLQINYLSVFVATNAYMKKKNVNLDPSPTERSNTPDAWFAGADAETRELVTVIHGLRSYPPH